MFFIVSYFTNFDCLHKGGLVCILGLFEFAYSFFVFLLSDMIFTEMDYTTFSKFQQTIKKLMAAWNVGTF